MHSSTPDNTKKSAKKSNTGSTQRIVNVNNVNVNFQSIKTKQGQLYNVLDSIKPDIIFGTENWIDNSIKDSQIFTTGYNIYRNDRNVNGGGVLLAVRDNLISSPVPELQTDWNWKAKQLKPKTQHVNIHHKFTDILDNHGLIQLVEEPTRGTNILDLIITNYPESFRRTEVMLGLSDHDIVYTEVNGIPAKLKQKPRKILLNKRSGKM